MGYFPEIPSAPIVVLLFTLLAVNWADNQKPVQRSVASAILKVIKASAHRNVRRKRRSADPYFVVHFPVFAFLHSDCLQSKR